MPNQDRNKEDLMNRGEKLWSEYLFQKEKGMQDLWDSQQIEGAVQKVPVGIPGLDEMLNGGLPRARAILVSGSAGCGKSILLNEFLYRGITRYNQGGVFLTFEETPKQIIEDAHSFDRDYIPLIESNRLAFVDTSPDRRGVFESGDYDWIEGLLARVMHAVEKTKASRVAIDGISNFFGLYAKNSEIHQIRKGIYLLTNELKSKGITVLFSSERIGHGDEVSRYGVEEFVSDGIIDINTTHGQNRIIRTLIIRKMRGMDFSSGRVEFEITREGITVFPKIPTDPLHAKTDFAVRLSTGITSLDEAMSGGIPQGHTMLVGGNTGTGKTIFGMHFLNYGCALGEPGIWVAIEEPIPQIIKTANAFDWDFEKYKQDGVLSFITSSLLDLSPDKLLYSILDKVKSIKAKRVVIDSVSSLESSSMDKDKVREFLVQASSFFKAEGLCCLMNYLTAESFAAHKDQLLGSMSTNEMRLSSIVDGIILLRYVERDQGVQKLLNILKLRGSEHVKDILRYEIGKEGICLGRRFGVSAGV